MLELSVLMLASMSDLLVCPDHLVESIWRDRCQGMGIGADASVGYTPPSFSSDLEWETVGAEEAGFKADDIQRLANFIELRSRSRTFLVLHRGRIMWESCWGGFQTGTDSAFFWASGAKSMISMAILAAIDRGHLTQDTTVSSVIGDGWIGSSSGSWDAPPESGSGTNSSITREAEITVGELLRMTSSITSGGTPDPAGPGESWHYVPHYGALFEVLSIRLGFGSGLRSFSSPPAELGNRTAWVAAMQAVLFDDLGMSPNLYFQAGTLSIEWARLWTTARNAGRLGLLMLQSGSWAGNQLLPQALVHDATSAAQGLNPAYGLLWWLNDVEWYLDPRGQNVSGRPVPSLPRDAYFAVVRDEGTESHM